MSSQYQSFVRAQMRSREASIRNRYQAEDEKRSRNIAVGELVGKTFMTGLDFRKDIVEQNILGQTTESGEKAFKYKSPEGGILGNIRRKFAPRNSDFEATKAFDDQLGNTGAIAEKVNVKSKYLETTREPLTQVRGSKIPVPNREASEITTNRFKNLMDKQKPGLGLVDDSIINEIATKSKTAPQATKVAGVLSESKGLTGKALGIAGKGANALNIGMNAKNLLFAEGRTGAERDKKRFDAGYGLGTTAIAAAPIPGARLLAGTLTLGKMLFDTRRR